MVSKSARTYEARGMQCHLHPCLLLMCGQPSTCHQFGAMGYGAYWGKITGTVGLSCACHMYVLPGGGVDLQKGERSVVALVVRIPY